MKKILELMNPNKKNMQHQNGISSVRYCASELSYSPRYLGDIVKKATGCADIVYIHSFIVEKSKNTFICNYLINL